MITSIFTLIIGIVKAIPVFKKWLDDFLKFYTAFRIKEHEEEFAKALQAIINGNQIPLEEAIGSDNAGKPTQRRGGIHERPRGGITNEEPTISGDTPSSNDAS